MGKRIIVPVVALVMSLGGLLLADGAPQHNQGMPNTTKSAARVRKKSSKKTHLGGVVVSVDAAAKQIVVRLGLKSNKTIGLTDTTIDVTDNTPITKDNKNIAISNIVAGDKVMVIYTKDGDKEIVSAIEVKIPTPVTLPGEKEAIPATK